MTASTAKCYWPDGSETGTHYKPCNSTDGGRVSSCCSLDDSYCTTSGACFWTIGGYYYRGGCTDSYWASFDCPKMCLEDKHDTRIYPCVPGVDEKHQTLCCGYNRTTNCCADNFTMSFGSFFSPKYALLDTISQSMKLASQSMTTSQSTTSSSQSTASSFQTTTSPPYGLSSTTSDVLTWSASTSATECTVSTPSQAGVACNPDSVAGYVGSSIGAAIGIGLISLATIFWREKKWRLRAAELKATERAGSGKHSAEAVSDLGSQSDYTHGMWSSPTPVVEVSHLNNPLPELPLQNRHDL
ncbi:hypothetical protein F4777DRAFT_537775 [Nemania sp. FL0916]|nr:hypothetical protein F4777DRAFT_537775 [Nemania sp. FL0916]